MRENILDKRREEGWRITLWLEPRAVVCQITTPPEDENKSPDVDIACRDFVSAVEFAKVVCRENPQIVSAARELVVNWKISPETFIALLNSCRIDSNKKGQ